MVPENKEIKHFNKLFLFTKLTQHPDLHFSLLEVSSAVFDGLDGNMVLVAKIKTFNYLAKCAFT